MRQFWTMATAVILCGVLFVILKPLADEPTFEEDIAQLDLPEMTEEAPAELLASGEDIDKIAEFPIKPAQREKLQELQKQRQQSIQGMVPARVAIPSIGVDAAIEATGILENGEMGVPEDINQVGWFEPGFKVGAKGHAVLAGHVDSYTGPAIFYHLKKVEAGEKVIVTDKDGREMVYEIQEKTSYVTDEAPIEEIFGPSDSRMINLITCTGTFNRDTGSHEERLVVTAKLISDSSVQDKQPEAPTNVTATSFNVSWHAVRDDAIIGYRVYEEDIETGEMKKVATVSLFDRKKVEITADDAKRYYVSSVDVDLNESEKTPAE
ncbi:class F sortase [Planomicrobium okeanokoites]|uniref:class F sortase n=1 Tax=Planomicrobium okeanokoites TaxID=244 RepID=UPI0009FE9FB9|nr:class F sortase [Planomicrobium okeanokoites]